MEYTIKKNRHSKGLRIIVRADGKVVVTMPYRLPKWMAQKFVKSKKEWIEERLKFLPEASKKRKVHYKNNKEEARKIILARVAELNKFYGFEYRKIAIRNQSTRWGSCSKNKNLNFNYQLMNVSPEERDYVIVHELCHLVQMNHSPKFWALVAKICPNYKELRHSLKKHVVL